MKTIRGKLILLFTSFMVGLVLLGVMLNFLFLENYYVHKNKKVFIEINTIINDEYNYGTNNIQSLIHEINRTEGITCYILDNKFKIKYSSTNTKAKEKSISLTKDIEDLILTNMNRLSSTNIYAKIEKQERDEAKLVFLSQSRNDDIIILSKPMKGIKESVAIANQFYLLAGIVMSSIGGIFIIILSKKITNPIVEMSDIAHNISNLKFKKYTKTISEDEVGNLAKSINNISDKLSNSINILQEDVNRRKQLVRNMSHELKSPIGIIKGYAEGLKYGVVEDKEDMEKYCNVIVEECDNMDKLIRQLLKISMLESGVFELNISNFSLNQLVKVIIEKFRPEINKNSISINYINEGALIINADYDLLERILINLISNGINHTSGKKYIEVTTKKINKGIIIKVFNTGNVIPLNDLDNIWQVFYKGNSTNKKDYGGHGLGLSIVKAAVDIQNGRVKVYNLEDGVCFEVFLPL